MQPASQPWLVGERTLADAYVFIDDLRSRLRGRVQLTTDGLRLYIDVVDARQNLTMRIGMRRFTRLTNAFSKKVENHAAAVALHLMHYNFCRVHQSLTVTREDGRRMKRTPAMDAGIANHPWSVYELLGLLDTPGSN